MLLAAALVLSPPLDKGEPEVVVALGHRVVALEAAQMPVGTQLPEVVAPMGGQRPLVRPPPITQMAPLVVLAMAALEVDRAASEAPPVATLPLERALAAAAAAMAQAALAATVHNKHQCGPLMGPAAAAALGVALLVGPEAAMAGEVVAAVVVVCMLVARANKVLSLSITPL